MAPLDQGKCFVGEKKTKQKLTKICRGATVSTRLERQESFQVPRGSCLYPQGETTFELVESFHFDISKYCCFAKINQEENGLIPKKV